MKLEDQVLLSFYQDISPLADNPRIMLVRHVETGQIYVRKQGNLQTSADPAGFRNPPDPSAGGNRARIDHH